MKFELLNETRLGNTTNISPETEDKIKAFQRRHRGAMSLLALQQH